MSRINQSHRERAAYIYIRQSKPEQVRENVESRRRQYGLTERARQLGFRDVHVIDEDLGRSGTGHVDRGGYEALLAAVCQGQVGAVLAVDASRLARNGPLTVPQVSPIWSHLFFRSRTDARSPPTRL